MSLFLETIKINNGRRINLDGHNARMNKVRNKHFHEIRDIDLRDFITVPPQFHEGIVKCRVIYGRKVEDVTFEKYYFKNPISFKLVYSDEIDYKEKSLDRNALDALYGLRGDADDIIIVKDGMITDSYYANLGLYKDGKWYTPDLPLLEGTFRTKLIEDHKIIPLQICVEDLVSYSKLKIFNALTEWEMHEAVEISRKTIY